MNTARATWHRLAPVERFALAACPLLTAALLTVLGQACHESIARGERLRAEQRVAPVVVAVAAAEAAQ